MTPGLSQPHTERQRSRSCDLIPALLQLLSSYISARKCGNILTVLFEKFSADMPYLKTPKCKLKLFQLLNVLYISLLNTLEAKIMFHSFKWAAGELLTEMMNIMNEN